MELGHIYKITEQPRGWNGSNRMDREFERCIIRYRYRAEKEGIVFEGDCKEVAEKTGLSSKSIINKANGMANNGKKANKKTWTITKIG